MKKSACTLLSAVAFLSCSNEIPNAEIASSQRAGKPAADGKASEGARTDSDAGAGATQDSKETKDPSIESPSDSQSNDTADGMEDGKALEANAGAQESSRAAPPTWDDKKAMARVAELLRLRGVEPARIAKLESLLGSLLPSPEGTAAPGATVAPDTYAPFVEKTRFLLGRAGNDASEANLIRHSLLALIWLPRWSSAWPPQTRMPRERGHFWG